MLSQTNGGFYFMVGRMGDLARRSDRYAGPRQPRLERCLVRHSRSDAAINAASGSARSATESATASVSAP